jgi:DNA primase
MFPITDRQGRVIAFGGRILGDGEPKYLNSPETDLFHKGNVLYGLAEAAPKVHKSGRIVVSEGYMDVIALHQAGLDEAVAPLGTALTEDHLRALWRLAREPILCFDGDAAGQRAAGRTVERALALLTPGHSLRLATLPAGEDPDSLIKSSGAGAMERVLELAVPLSEALWRLEIGSQRPETPEDRAWLEEKLKRQAARITDETVRRHFLDAFRDRLWQEFRAARRPPAGQARGGRMRAGQVGAGMAAPLPTRAAVAASAARAPGDLIQRREAILLAVLINHPDLSDDISERLGLMEFSAPELDKLRQEVLKTLAGGQGLDRSVLNSHLVSKGLSEELKGILGPRVVEHAFFARPEALPELALLGWEETYSMYRTAELQRDLHEATQRLADGDSSRETYDRFLALKSQEDQLIADQMEREGNYPSHGLIKE